MKWRGACGGDPLLSGLHRLQVVHWSTATTGDPAIDATPTDAATTGPYFRLTGQTWHYNLDTLATHMRPGIWQLVATLSDGSAHTAWFSLK